MDARIRMSLFPPFFPLVEIRAEILPRQIPEVLGSLLITSPRGMPKRLDQVRDRLSPSGMHRDSGLR